MFEIKKPLFGLNDYEWSEIKFVSSDRKRREVLGQTVRRPLSQRKLFSGVSGACFYDAIDSYKTVN